MSATFCELYIHVFIDGKIGIAVVGALVGIVLAGVFLAVVYRCYKNKTKVKVSQHVCCIIYKCKNH